MIRAVNGIERVVIITRKRGPAYPSCEHKSCYPTEITKVYSRGR